MFVAVAELQRIKRTTSALKAAPIARAFRPVSKTILPRCFRLQRDRLALDTLQTASTATRHSWGVATTWYLWAGAGPRGGGGVG